LGLGYLALIVASAAWGRPNAAPLPIDLYLGLLGATFLPYALLVRSVTREAMPGRVCQFLMVVAIAARLVTLAGPHRTNSDLWRYVWDGHVLARGYNPFAHAPADPALDPIRDPGLFGHLNPAYNGIRTVYGPVAVASFALTAVVPGDPAATVRWMMVAGDVATIVLLIALLRHYRMPESWALVYALNPLLIDALAQRGQMEGLLLPLLVAVVLLEARDQTLLAGAALATAVMVKVVAVLLVPLLLIAWLRRGRTAAARGVLGLLIMGAVAAIPLATAGLESSAGLLTYASAWHTNGSIFDLAAMVVGDSTARGLSVALSGLVAVAVALAIRRGADLAVLAPLPLFGLVLLAPSLFPWYVTWLLPFTPFLLASSRWRKVGVAMLVWSGTVLLWYLRFLVYPPTDAPQWPALATGMRAASDHLVEPWRLVEYAPVYIILALGGVCRTAVIKRRLPRLRGPCSA